MTDTPLAPRPRAAGSITVFDKLMREVIGLFAALVLVGAADAEPSRPSAATGPLSGPTYFMDGRKKDPPLLAMIRRGMAKTVDFAGRYSSSIVSCGVACNSFWLVDRRTGAVIAAPESEAEDEFTWDIVTKPESDLIHLVVGPIDDAGAKCFSLSYRWTGNAFVVAGKRTPVRCPG